MEIISRLVVARGRGTGLQVTAGRCKVSFEGDEMS